MLKQNYMVLTEKVLDYQKTGKGFEELFKTLSLKAYFYPKYKLNGKLDLCGEFLLFFYPALMKTIRAYQDQGRSFDHYFNSTLRLQLRCFLRQKKESNIKWKNAWYKDFWDLPYLDNPTPEKGHKLDLSKVLRFNAHNKIKSDIEKRQLLFFALKKSRTMTEQNIQYLSSVTGYEKDWIFDLVEKLKVTIQSKEQRLRIQQCRKKTAYSKIIILERYLKQEYDIEKKERMQMKINKLRLVYIRACHSVSNIQLAPTQKAIAEATGFAKGTVDSAIFAFKKKILRVYLN